MTLIPTTDRTQYCFVDCGKEICECKPTKNIKMNKEKTAIQMLIDELKQMEQGVEDRIISIHLGHCISKANRLLKKEQEQIEQAFDDGCDDQGIITSKDYYQSKYVNNG